MSQSMPMTDPWIAAEKISTGWRAWVMEEDAVQQGARSAADLKALRALSPSADILAIDEHALDQRMLPAKPSEMIPSRSGKTEGEIYTLPTLVQSTPTAVIAGNQLRIDAFLSLNKNWDGVICLVGETSQWAQVSADEIVSVQSFATGGLVRALWPQQAQGLHPDVLKDALTDVMSTPERLAARIEECRTGYALGQYDDSTAQSRLWGACLGAELAAARAYWLGQNVALIASGVAAPAYRFALESQFIPFTEADEERLTLLGFLRAHKRVATEA